MARKSSRMSSVGSGIAFPPAALDCGHSKARYGEEFAFADLWLSGILFTLVIVDLNEHSPLYRRVRIVVLRAAMRQVLRQSQSRKFLPQTPLNDRVEFVDYAVSRSARLPRFQIICVYRV